MSKLPDVMKKYNPEQFAALSKAEITTMISDSARIVTDRDNRKYISIKDVEKLKQQYNF